MGYYISGLSGSTGFQIFDLENGIRVKTKDYSETSERRLWRKSYEIEAWIGRRLEWFPPFRLISSAVFGIIRNIMCAWWERESRKCPSAIKDPTSEWHSCEHKLIHLIEGNQKITSKSIQDADSYSSDCGSGKGQKQLDWLKEPSLEKIKETVRVGREYYKKLQEKNKDKEGKKK